MDYLTQHFIAWARKEIGKLVERLNGVDEILQRQAKTEHKTNTSGEEHQHSPTILRAELQIPHSKKYEDEAEAARALVRENWKLYIEIFTLLVVFGYTTVAAFQLSEMRKSTKASTDIAQTTSDALGENRRQFQETLKQMKAQTRSQVAAVATSKDANALARQAVEAQTRPWIGIDGIPNVTTPTTTGELPDHLDEVRLQNFGLSPAFYVTVKFGAVFPRDSFRPTFPEMKDVCSVADSGMDEALARVDSPIPIITVFPGKDGEQSVKGVHFGHMNKLPGTYLIGCIAYKDAMSFRHHTWVVYFMSLSEVVRQKSVFQSATLVLMKVGTDEK